MATKSWDTLQQWGASLADSDLLPKLEGGGVDWVVAGGCGLVGVLALVAGAFLYARRDTEFVRNLFRRLRVILTYCLALVQRQPPPATATDDHPPIPSPPNRNVTDEFRVQWNARIAQARITYV